MNLQQLNGQVPTQTSLMALSHRHDGGRRGPLLELRRLSPLLCDDSRGAGRSKHLMTEAQKATERFSHRAIRGLRINKLQIAQIKGTVSL